MLGRSVRDRRGSRRNRDRPDEPDRPNATNGPAQRLDRLIRSEGGVVTQIRDVIPVVGRSGFFNRDLAAVKAGARADGFAYPGTPLSPGFQKIVQPGTAISLMLLLDDGQVAFGDCTDVILTGVAGTRSAVSSRAASRVPEHR